LNTARRDTRGGKFGASLVATTNDKRAAARRSTRGATREPLHRTTHNSETPAKPPRAAANAQLDEVVALADEKGALLWKAAGMMHQGCVLALTNKASKAIHMFTAGITAWLATGSTLWVPLWFPYLSKAYAALGQFDDAWRCIGEAMTAVETTRERWWEADIHRTAGEIALMSPQPGAAKAQTYFEHALEVARQQQAKSWELRAAMSLARLWRDQGKMQQARELLAPVYGWFTEGFDTRDRKEAKALLDELRA
jgi:predicted ATPase